MSKHPVCDRCRIPPAKLDKHKRPQATDGEHPGLYERRDNSGKWLCMPCILILTYEAEVLAANRALDAAMSEHLRHQSAGRFAGCPICAVEV